MVQQEARNLLKSGKIICHGNISCHEGTWWVSWEVPASAVKNQPTGIPVWQFYLPR